MTDEKVTDAVWERILNDLHFGRFDGEPSQRLLAKMLHLYLAQQIAAAEIRGVREGFQKARERIGHPDWDYEYEEVDDYLNRKKG